MMRWLALLTCLIAGCGPRVSVIPQQTRFDVTPPLETLPMGLYADCPWIAGPDGAMVIDTGAGLYVISDEIAQQHQYKRLSRGKQHIDAHGTHGRSQAVVEIDELRLGQVVLRDFAGIVMRRDQLPDIDRQPLVVLGRGPLADCRITLDYPARRVTLEPASKHPIAPDALPLLAGDPPRVAVKVAGRTVQLGLDTGCSRGITLPWSWREKLPLEHPPVQTFISRSAFGTRHAWAARLDANITIAGHVLHRPIVNFIPDEELNILGGEVLKHFVITFDQRTPAVLFRRAAGQTGPIEMPSICDFGMDLSRSLSAEGITIAAVTPKSDAAAQGIAAGDRVLAIDGTPIARFDDWPRLMPGPDSPPVRVTIAHGDQAPREIRLRPTVLVP